MKKPKNLSALEILKLIEFKLEAGNFIDSVHKIKLLTTKEMIEKMLISES
jgi:hypothetical protein